MTRVALFAVALFLSQVAQAKIVVKQVDYKVGDADMTGYAAYDDQWTDARPGIVVIHEWWGNNEYPKSRAEQLAQLGYVAFAADMYGSGKTTDDPKQAGEWAGKIKGDSKLGKERLDAAIDQLKKLPNVDANRLGAIGYCFGGTCVLNMARWGEPVKAVVSFHGDLSTKEPAKHVDAKILVCSGEADAFVPPSQIDSFKKEMVDASAEAKIITYPDAKHAFTNPKADEHHIDNIQYNAAADKKSWEDMKAFFEGVFGK